MGVNFTRGTTPQNTFEVPIDLTACDVIYITYSQYGAIVFEIEKDDIEVSADKLVVSGLSNRNFAMSSTKMRTIRTQTSPVT